MADLFANNATFTTTSTSGTTTPVTGTSEGWTCNALSALWPNLTGTETMSIQDPVAQSEIIRITASSGSGDTTITVTRGADGTTPVAHATGATFICTVVASALNAFPTYSADLSALGILIGSANVESIIRANSVNQLALPTANTPWGTNRLTGLAPGITSTDAVNAGQLASNQYAYVITGCAWTASAPASTLVGAMSSGTVMIQGIQLTVPAVASHTFSASSDTYIDLANNLDGTANITYTTVPNNTISPALTGSGTLINTIRVACVVSTASALTSTAVSCLQGNPNISPATAQFSTTVAVASNGAQINASTLTLAAGTGVPTGGGWCKVAHASGQTYVIQFTGIIGAVLQGVTVIAGTPTLLVSTSDVVTGINNVATTDMLGNLIFPTWPYPRLIGSAGFLSSFTLNLTTVTPLPGLVAPFILPPGPNRNYKISVFLVTVTSSGAPGTTITVWGGVGNSGSFATNGTPGMIGYVSVSNDGWPMFGEQSLNGSAGSYTAQVGVVQSATGGAIGSGFNGCYIQVELI